MKHIYSLKWFFPNFPHLRALAFVLSPPLHADLQTLYALTKYYYRVFWLFENS